MHILIPYIKLLNHPDPLFNEYTYGETKLRALQLKNNLNTGDYVFFHTSIGGKKYITAYYVVDRVMDLKEVVTNENLRTKYHNPHIKDYISDKGKKFDYNVLIFGDPIESNILPQPLPLDKKLAGKLSLNISFPKNRTEMQAIVSSTRSHRTLTQKDITILLKEIKKLGAKPKIDKKIYSTDEVMEVIEKDIEGVIEKRPGIFGKDLKLVGRQIETDTGRIDLLLKDKSGNHTVVELKLNKIGREAINQIRRYMKWLQKQQKKKVKGVIVCKGVMPIFEEEFKKIKNIKIYVYGWKFGIQEYV